MKINKQEALALTKVLHQHVGNPYLASSEVEKSEFQETLEEVSARLDDFLVYGEEADDCCEEEEDEEAEDDDEGEEDSSDEGDEEDDEDEDEDEDSSEEDDGDDDEDEEEEPESDSYATPGDLHELSAAKTSNGSLEFEDTESADTVDLLVGGYTEISGVRFIRRKSKELHVSTGNGEWDVYAVPRFPKGWADALPLDELVEVEA